MKFIRGGENLEPKTLWNNFDRILSFPHPSKGEKLLAEHILSFAKGLGLEAFIDGTGNVIVKKPANPVSMSNRAPILLQAHIDMVPQKTEQKKHDFNKDPIMAYVDGKYVKAEETTLGADNGIGAAAILSVLESKTIEHGPIEALFTVDEEAGMGGVNGLEPGQFKSEIMLNLDSDPEGEFFIGCAGGRDTEITFNFIPGKIPPDTTAYKISISGFRGGHSGSNIHEGRGNSIKTLARLLCEADRKFNIFLSAINGGTLRNVIPSKAQAVVAINSKQAMDFEILVKDFNAMLKKEYAATAPDLVTEAQKTALPDTCMDAKTKIGLIKALNACPNEVFRMDDKIEGLVETSSNLGVITTDNNIVNIKTLHRSSVDSAKEYASEMIASVFELAGASKIERKGGYPGWKPNLDSKALKLAKETYMQIYGKEPKVKAIHAGLECAIIGGKYPKLQMVSFGPDIEEAHSVNERVGIESVGKFWKLLCSILKNAPVN